MDPFRSFFLLYLFVRIYLLFIVALNGIKIIIISIKIQCKHRNFHMLGNYVRFHFFLFHFLRYFPFNFYPHSYHEMCNITHYPYTHTSAFIGTKIIRCKITIIFL